MDGKLLSYSYLEAGLIETLATYVLLLFLGIKVLIYFYLKINRLVAYFVVFFRNGFTPSDLVRAQNSGRT